MSCDQINGTAVDRKFGERDFRDDITCNNGLFSDERDNIQKKTFTKWVNKHLLKVSLI